MSDRTLTALILLFFLAMSVLVGLLGAAVGWLIGANMEAGLGILMLAVLVFALASHWWERRSGGSERSANSARRAMDKTALSYWFPLIQAAGLPVPRTRSVKMPEAAMRFVSESFEDPDADLNKAPAEFDAWAAEMKAAGSEIGFPCFLRSDHTSGKHEWERTCCVPSADAIVRHALNIAYYSECASLIGLPWDSWAVREMLPTEPLGLCRGFSNMPVCREFRFFVDGAKTICVHPYWPERALRQGRVDPIDYAALCDLNFGDRSHLRDLASAAGAAVGGYWSVDILETSRGWVVIDMAEGEKSFHWDGCLKAPS